MSWHIIKHTVILKPNGKHKLVSSPVIAKATEEEVRQLRDKWIAANERMKIDNIAYTLIEDE